MTRILRIIALAAILTAYAVLTVMVLADDADAHMATPTAAQPLGWVYGTECCSVADCQDMPAGEIKSTKHGWRVESTGEVIPFADSRIKRSRDERFHRCSSGGDFTRDRSLCLYVPDQGF